MATYNEILTKIKQKENHFDKLKEQIVLFDKQQLTKAASPDQVKQNFQNTLAAEKLKLSKIEE